jgi:transcriptional regulator with XRE-family HTH domain
MQKSTHTAEYTLLRTELRRVRENAGLSQRDLADRLDVPHSWVAKVEAGERRIDVLEFHRLTTACGEASSEVFAAWVKAIAAGRKAGGRRR